jgi:toxin ParE1/3/4
MRIVYRERALADLEQISTYLQPLSRSGATNVLAAIHAAITIIGDHPLGARRTSDPGVRVKVVGRYGYKIFYATSPDAVEILHIRHGARRPWFSERGEEDHS